VKGGARHVSFTGADTCAIPGGSSPFGSSIPLEKAVAAESLVAYEMNGAPLEVEHGFPARALVPGFIGARSVKWIATISVSDRPSENFFHAKAYRRFRPDATPETAKWDQAEPVLAMNTNSVICDPAEGGQVRAGRVGLRGYAIAATGRGIVKVEASVNGGESWKEARLLPGEGAFSWRLWETEVSLGQGPAILAVRAWDSGGDVQPEEPMWNFPGYLCNGWHRVPVTVV
jgi:sulfite oxidase